MRRPATAIRRLVLLTSVLALAFVTLAAPAGAADLGNPAGALGGGVVQPTSTAVTANTSSSTGNGGASTELAVIIVASALILIGVIAWFIMHDARVHAPARESALSPFKPRRSAAQRQRDRRAAKAARTQRRRNR